MSVDAGSGASLHADAFNEVVVGLAGLAESVGVTKVAVIDGAELAGGAIDKLEVIKAHGADIGV